MTKTMLMGGAAALVLALGGCAAGGADSAGSASAGSTDAGSSQATVAQGAMLPAPFSASLIRAAAWEGKTTVYRQRQAGSDWTWQRTEYSEVTPATATFTFTNLDQDGFAVGEPQTSTATWEELESHAIYPADSTRKREAKVTVPAGNFDCWLYEVRGEENGQSTLVRAHFAKSMPGPPVRFEQVVEGQQVFLMELVRGPGTHPDA